VDEARLLKMFDVEAERVEFDEEVELAVPEGEDGIG
jgi:hypothetical protein